MSQMERVRELARIAGEQASKAQVAIAMALSHSPECMQCRAKMKDDIESAGMAVTSAFTLLEEASSAIAAEMAKPQPVMEVSTVEFPMQPAATVTTVPVPAFGFPLQPVDPVTVVSA